MPHSHSRLNFNYSPHRLKTNKTAVPLRSEQKMQQIKQKSAIIRVLIKHSYKTKFWVLITHTSSMKYIMLKTITNLSNFILACKSRLKILKAMIHQDMEVEVVLDVMGNDFSRVLRITITTYLAKVHFLHL